MFNEHFLNQLSSFHSLLTFCRASAHRNFEAVIKLAIAKLYNHRCK
jgi:hypothetical protein